MRHVLAVTAALLFAAGCLASEPEPYCESRLNPVGVEVWDPKCEDSFLEWAVACSADAEICVQEGTGDHGGRLRLVSGFAGRCVGASVRCNTGEQPRCIRVAPCP